jgi:hypothetical protein
VPPVQEFLGWPPVALVRVLPGLVTPHQMARFFFFFFNKFQLFISTILIKRAETVQSKSKCVVGKK